MHKPPDTPIARPGLPAILLAPWRGITRPTAAGRTLAQSGWLGLLATFVLPIAILIAGNILIALVHETYLVRYYSRLDYIHAPGDAAHFKPVESTLAATWTSWRTQEHINPAWFIIGGISGNGCVALAALTLLFFHRVHRAGPLWPSLRRSTAAVVAAVGLALLLNFLIGSGFVLLEYERIARHWFNPAPTIFAVLAVQAGILLMLHWIGRAANGASDETFVLELSPRCESCGYDLTHRPDSGLCPECNASVAASLEPGRRQPTAYERAPGLAEFFDTSRHILLHPADAYSALALSGSIDRAARYRRWHVTAMAALAALWVFVAMWIDRGRPPHDDKFFICPVVGLAVGIVAWTMTHLAGMVAGFYWLYHRTLPDTRWVQRIACLETVYVWVFCGLSGTIITSLMLWGDWVGRRLNPMTGVAGVRLPTAPLLLLGANLILVVIWVIRWLRIGRSVRWSNY